MAAQTALASPVPFMEGKAGVVNGKLLLSQGIERKLGGAAGQFNEIPIVDLSPLTSPDATATDKERLVNELQDACKRAGFFVAKNHGIDWQIVENAFEAAEAFFSLPMETKMKLHQSNSPSFMGYEEPYYTNVDRLKKGDLRETMTTAYDPRVDPKGKPDIVPPLQLRKNQWPSPEDCPKFRPATEAYRYACLDLMRRLIRVMALALGEKEDFFDKKTDYPNAGARAVYYPPQDPIDENSTGLGAHTDMQCMTMIAQKPYDVQSLEVLNAKGEWIQPRLEPQTFVINLGDTIGRLSNNVFQSTVHRVRNISGKPRYSLPFFFGVSNDELIHTLPQFVTADTPLCEGYDRPITGYEHFNFRMQRAHHLHPSNVAKLKLGLPYGMTKIDGKIVEGM